MSGSGICSRGPFCVLISLFCGPDSDILTMSGRFFNELLTSAVDWLIMIIVINKETTWKEDLPDRKS